MTPVDKNMEPLDAILRRAMRAQPGPATPECADAEALAAYSDRSLAARERERLETHFADCARCQLLLAEIARADESARVAKSAGGVPWYRRWRLTIPAMAAAAAVLVFISMRRSAPVEQPNDQLAATAQSEFPAANVASKQPSFPPVPAAAPSAPVSVAAAAPSNEIAMNEPKPEAAPRMQSMGAMRELKRSAEAPGQAIAASGGSASNAGAQPLAESASAPLPAAPAAAPPAAMNSRVEAFGSSSRGMAAGAVAGAGGIAGSAVAVSPSEGLPSASLVTIWAPDHSVSWLAGRNGMILRRDAAGGTHPQQSGVTTDLVAGAAPSSTVCWIVGRSGTIVSTTDGGGHWALILGPTTENLTAVTANDANNATITTSGGRSFTTSDGGATWHPQ